MSTNGFRDDELVSRKVKVGNEWQTRVFPMVGGRLQDSPREQRPPQHPDRDCQAGA